MPPRGGGGRSQGHRWPEGGGCRSSKLGPKPFLKIHKVCIFPSQNQFCFEFMRSNTPKGRVWPYPRGAETPETLLHHGCTPCGRTLGFAPSPSFCPDPTPPSQSIEIRSARALGGVLSPHGVGECLRVRQPSRRPEGVHHRPRGHTGGGEAGWGRDGPAPGAGVVINIFLK